MSPIRYEGGIGPGDPDYDAKINIEYGPRRKGDAEISVANIDKIKQMIDWTPKYNKLDFIIKTSIDWEIKLKNENFS